MIHDYYLYPRMRVVFDEEKIPKMFFKLFIYGNIRLPG